MTRLCSALTLVLSLAAPLAAQDLTSPPPRLRPTSLAGPRFGFSMLGPGIVDDIAAHGVTLKPMISQFGWQFEKQFTASGGAASYVNELVLLFGGLDQGAAVPSASWLVGVRTRDGVEVGIGPNVTPLGVGLVLAAGVSMRAGGVNVPVNIAVVPSRQGARLTVLTGFSMRH